MDESAEKDLIHICKIRMNGIHRNRYFPTIEKYCVLICSDCCTTHELTNEFVICFGLNTEYLAIVCQISTNNRLDNQWRFPLCNNFQLLELQPIKNDR